MTLITPASATQLAPATPTAVQTMAVCAREGQKSLAMASVGEDGCCVCIQSLTAYLTVHTMTLTCHVSVTTSVPSMATAVLTMMMSVMEELEAACLMKT